MDRILPRNWKAFAKRRKRVMLGIFVPSASLMVAICSVLPATYTARATVTPDSAHYEGPVPRLVAQATTDESLEQVSDRARLPAKVSVLQEVSGTPSRRIDRLRSDDHELIEPRSSKGKVTELEVWISGPSEVQAKAGADALAEHLVALDAELHENAKPNEVEPVSPQGPTASEVRLKLQDLRDRHPLLRDPKRLERHRAAKRKLIEERDAMGALGVLLKNLELKTHRLWEQVQEEAGDAYAAWKLERKKTPDTPVVRRTEDERAGQEQKAKTKLEKLEAELRRLLAKYTDRHPDVVRVMEHLRIEREHTEPEPEFEPEPELEPEKPKPVPKKKAEKAARPANTFHVAEDDEDDAIERAEIPGHFLHEAKSYSKWLTARDQVDDARASLEAKSASLRAQESRYLTADREMSRLRDGYQEARGEEQALVTQLEAIKDQPANPGATTLGPRSPLVLGERARVHDVDDPGEYRLWVILAAALLAFIVGLVAERRDRSFHDPGDVTGALAVPVLGVIPHLRKRRVT